MRSRFVADPTSGRVGSLLNNPTGHPLLRVRGIVFRSRVAGPNVVSTHEEGGTAGRPTGPCFLALM